ncbi:hypothetical protein [Mycoplasma sp. P36-A1]|uniref:hypothetical protein n=1 Tax=Mycoplasma sp. P36-A1 TaxID=3252900 RepID=UPI003C30072C
MRKNISKVITLFIVLLIVSSCSANNNSKEVINRYEECINDTDIRDYNKEAVNYVSQLNIKHSQFTNKVKLIKSNKDTKCYIDGDKKVRLDSNIINDQEYPIAIFILYKDVDIKEIKNDLNILLQNNNQKAISNNDVKKLLEDEYFYIGKYEIRVTESEGILEIRFLVSVVDVE